MSTAAFYLQERSGDCPYCGERLSLLLDPQDAGAEYVEDCQVCCCPMLVTVRLDEDGDAQVQIRRED